MAQLALKLKTKRKATAKKRKPSRRKPSTTCAITKAYKAEVAKLKRKTKTLKKKLTKVRSAAKVRKRRRKTA